MYRCVAMSLGGLVYNVSHHLLLAMDQDVYYNSTRGIAWKIHYKARETKGHATITQY